MKIFQDGVIENFTAAMLEPYLDRHGRATTNAGMSFVDPILLRDHVTALDAFGFQVHFHAIGDRGVREALDAFEAARTANGWSDARHHISHIQVIHPTDVPRFRQLGVAANMQPLWACREAQMDELTIPFLGPERTGRRYPFGSLHRAGATIVGGSDWSVSTPNPLWEIEVAVNRVYPDTRGESEPFLPEERLALPDAIAAFTAGTARQPPRRRDRHAGGRQARGCGRPRPRPVRPWRRRIGDARWSRRSSKGSPSSRTTSRPDGSDRLPEMRRCGRAALWTDDVGRS